MGGAGGFEAEFLAPEAEEVGAVVGPDFGLPGAGAGAEAGAHVAGLSPLKVGAEERDHGERAVPRHVAVDGDPDFVAGGGAAEGVFLRGGGVKAVVCAGADEERAPGGDGALGSEDDDGADEHTQR